MAFAARPIDILEERITARALVSIPYLRSIATFQTDSISKFKTFRACSASVQTSARFTRLITGYTLLALSVHESAIFADTDAIL